MDVLLAVYNGVAAGLWLFVAFRSRSALVLVLAHAAAASLPLVLARAPEHLSRPVRWLREGYPLIWIPVLWIELDPLIGHLHRSTFDAQILALDLAVFGAHLDRVWMPAMPQVWFSELMHLAYYAYLPLIFLPPLAVAAAGRMDAFRDMTLRLMATYVACYLFYLALPVVGPHEFGVPYHGSLADGLLYRLGHGAHQSGNVRGAAFPSSHVAGAVTIAILGWRWMSRPVAILLSVEALGVLMSTVYTQNHYGVDSVAGLCWALLVQFALVPLLLAPPAAARARRGRERRAPAPAPLTARVADLITGGGS